MSTKIPPKVVERLLLYRQILRRIQNTGGEFIFSHELASIARASSAQVRRDLMMLKHSGTPQRGYNIRMILDEIGSIVDTKDGQNVALVGVGNLGRAIISYFSTRKPKLKVIAAFDVDEQLIGTEIYGCPCHHITDLGDIAKEENIRVGIIAVPGKIAQDVADILVEAGVNGVVNFAPQRIHVPSDVFLENVDITIAIEKAAYFAIK
ncbi:MAG: redox-sensing transcriptional repressor Rex [Bacteriovoracaceae bacterium]|nr:redox-sensing transcriptional repressor Rex [Bacteriovoracaceae bacterium]